MPNQPSFHSGLVVAWFNADKTEELHCCLHLNNACLRSCNIFLLPDQKEKWKDQVVRLAGMCVLLKSPIRVITWNVVEIYSAQLNSEAHCQHFNHTIVRGI